MNSVHMIGNLGADPRITKTPSGRTVANLRIAVDTQLFRKDEAGQTVRSKRTDWISVTVWGGQAEACGTYLQKGSKVAVEGSLRSRTWEQDGRTMYALEVEASDVVFLGKIKALEGAPLEEE